MQNQIKPKKILGIATYSYSENKIKSDINTYWDELFWEKDKYLTRYKKIYKDTIKN